MTVRVHVDVVVLSLSPAADDDTGTLTVQTLLHDSRPPRLPGDVLGEAEDLDDAARRVMGEVGLHDPRHVEQVASFGAPDRMPDQRTVSVTHLALVHRPFAPSEEWRWRSATDRPQPLAWDHDRILDAALDRVRSKLSYSNIAYGLLPEEFTMSELQEVYEAVLGMTLDKRNFRKKVRGLGLLEETGGMRRGSHRPAALHRFTSSELVLLDEGPLV
ncbi:MAG: NUDIX hydrolase [Actinomycetota bacterium]